MSRDINWDEELSEEDRKWAEERSDAPAGFGKTMGDRIRENDEKFGKEAKDAAKTREERMVELRTSIAEAENELERLVNEAAREGNPNIAVTGDPASGLVRDNTAISGEKPEGAPDEEEDYSNTKYWTVPRLQQEISARNADRTSAGLPPLNDQGKRAELVERLLKDDEEIAASEGSGV